jgi:acyl dehydratase
MDLEDVRALIGKKLGPTGWMSFDQKIVDDFSRASGMDHWIHTDPERAKASPFGATLVPAQQILSRTGILLRDLWVPPEGVKSTLLYGFDKVRVPAPLKVGQRMRAHFTMAEAEMKRKDLLLVAFDVTMEAEGSERPTVTARWLVAFMY